MADEDFIKPSKHKQWHEKSSAPIAVKMMTKGQILELRRVFVLSYGCDDNDITYEFLKIKDSEDEDRDDCLWLKYKMKCIRYGKPIVVDIFTIKVPFPEELKIQADRLKKQQAQAPQLQIANTEANTEANNEVNTETAAPPRPRVRRPATRQKK